MNAAVVDRDTVQRLAVNGRLPRTYRDAVRAVAFAKRAHRDALATLKLGVQADRLVAVVDMCVSTYAEAKRALRACNEFDELAAWSRPEALAGYARVSLDSEKLINNVGSLEELRRDVVLRLEIIRLAMPHQK